MKFLWDWPSKVGVNIPKHRVDDLNLDKGDPLKYFLLIGKECSHKSFYKS